MITKKEMKAMLLHVIQAWKNRADLAQLAEYNLGHDPATATRFPHAMREVLYLRTELAETQSQLRTARNEVHFLREDMLRD